MTLCELILKDSSIDDNEIDRRKRTIKSFLIDISNICFQDNIHYLYGDTDRACTIVPLSVLLYQILVYYNCKTYRDNPMAIIYMLGT